MKRRPWAAAAALLLFFGSVPAEEPDCNGNGVADAADIDSGTSRDCDLDGVPDECLPLRFDFKFQQTLRPGLLLTPFVGPLVAEDLDGDGWVDVATTRSTTRHVSILWGEGGRRFSPSEEIAIPFPSHVDSLVALDLESDGDLDLAVLKRPLAMQSIDPPPDPTAVAEDLALLRNEGGRVFRLERLEELAEAPGLMKAGDLDGDGAEDLLVAEGATWDAERREWAFSSNLLVLWNDGSGGFGERTAVDVLELPGRGFYAADLSGDGRADILAIARNLPVLVLSRGGRSFEEPIVLPDETRIAPWDAAFADLDLDGDLDVAISHVDTNRVTLLRNVAPGRLEVWAVLREDRNTDQPVFADLDRDGRLDLIAGGGFHAVWYAAADGLPAVREYRRYASGGGVAARAVRDVDRDGWPDIITHTSVVYNRGDGGLEAPRLEYLYDRNRFSPNRGVTRSVARDFDLDGDIDIATGYAGISWNDGEGGFEELSMPVGGRTVEAADLDLDGDQDIILVEGRGWAALENLGGREFVQRARKEVGFPFFSRAVDFCALWDFDRNGFVDFAFGDEWGRAFVSYNAGGWDLSELALAFDEFEPRGDENGFVWGSVTGIEAGDWDRDGRGDLAVLQHTRLPPDYRELVGRVALVFGDGERSFERRGVIELDGAGMDIRRGDFNQDGIDDLVVGGGFPGTPTLPGSWIAVFLGDGEGGFKLRDRRQILHLFPYVEPADLDQDGDLDVLVTGGTVTDTDVASLTTTSGNNLEVFLNRGDGTLARRVEFPLGGAPAQAVVEDLNGDGRVDLAVTLRIAHMLLVALNEAPGDVTAPQAGPCEVRFRRGAPGFATSLALAQHLFGGGAAPLCQDASDANDDGEINLSDVIYPLSFVFRGGLPPPVPWPECGLDPTPDDLDCKEYASCSE